MLLLCSRKYRFAANPIRTEGTYSKYHSIDDKIDPFHYYTTLIKFELEGVHMMLQEVEMEK